MVVWLVALLKRVKLVAPDGLEEHQPLNFPENAGVEPEEEPEPFPLLVEGQQMVAVHCQLEDTAAHPAMPLT